MAELWASFDLYFKWYLTLFSTVLNAVTLLFPNPVKYVCANEPIYYQLNDAELEFVKYETDHHQKLDSL